MTLQIMAIFEWSVRKLARSCYFYRYLWFVPQIRPFYFGAKRQLRSGRNCLRRFCRRKCIQPPAIRSLTVVNFNRRRRSPNLLCNSFTRAKLFPFLSYSQQLIALPMDSGESELYPEDKYLLIHRQLQAAITTRLIVIQLTMTLYCPLVRHLQTYIYMCVCMC